MAQGPPENTSQSRGSFVVGQEFNPYRQFKVVCIPEPVFLYRGLSQGAKLTYGRLVRYAGEDGKAFPAVGTLAAELDVSINQARRYLQELTAKRFIRVDPCDGKSNHYKFLWHEAFIEVPPTSMSPLPSMGGVAVAELQVPLPSMGGVPLPSMTGVPLPSMGDEESQSKRVMEESQSARAHGTIREAIEAATRERVRNDRLVCTILEFGRLHSLPPPAMARFIRWNVYDRQAAGYRVSPGLVVEMVLKESLLWAKQNADLVFRLQEEELCKMPVTSAELPLKKVKAHA